MPGENRYNRTYEVEENEVASGARVQNETFEEYKVEMAKEQRIGGLGLPMVMSWPRMATRQVPPKFLTKIGDLHWNYWGARPKKALTAPQGG